MTTWLRFSCGTAHAYLPNSTRSLCERRPVTLPVESYGRQSVDGGPVVTTSRIRNCMWCLGRLGARRCA
jgi:hypothetical protein